MSNLLTRAQVEEIVEHMTPRDLFNAMPTATDSEVAGSELAAAVFDKAAERQGFGAEALDRVSMADANHLVSLLGEVFQAATPKGKRPAAKQPLPDSGG